MLYISSSGKPLFDADRKFLGYRGTAADITVEVRAEQAEQALREAQLALAHANRVETMGQLAASIAHEVNQPIAAAITSARNANVITGATGGVEQARRLLTKSLGADHSRRILDRVASLRNRRLSQEERSTPRRDTKKAE